MFYLFPNSQKTIEKNSRVFCFILKIFYSFDLSRLKCQITTFHPKYCVTILCESCCLPWMVLCDFTLLFNISDTIVVVLVYSCNITKVNWINYSNKKVFIRRWPKAYLNLLLTTFCQTILFPALKGVRSGISKKYVCTR